MKKVIPILCVLAAVITAVSLFSVSSAQEITYLRGDANGDGKINVNDVTAIQRLLAQLEPDPDGAMTRRADIDGNGLMIDDATELQSYLAEFESAYQIGEEVHYTPPVTHTRDPYELPFVPAR